MIRSPSAAIDQRLGAEFGAADREAAHLAGDRGDAGSPGRAQQQADVGDGVGRFRGVLGRQNRGAAEAAFAVAGGEDAEVADRGGDLFDVDASFLEAALELAGGDLSGDAVGVDLVDRFLEAIAEVGRGDGGEGTRRAASRAAREASPVGGLSPLRSLLKSISTWSEPGIRLATAVASSGSIPALSRNCCASGSISAARLVDQSRRCRRRRRRGCRWGPRSTVLA